MQPPVAEGVPEDVSLPAQESRVVLDLRQGDNGIRETTAAKTI